MTTLPSALKDFYLNETMRNDVKTYLMDYLKVSIIEEAFDPEFTLKKDDRIKALGGCKEVLDKAFENLDVLFTPKSEGKEVKNPAR